AQRELAARPFELVIAEPKAAAALLPAAAGPLVVHAAHADTSALDLLDAGAYARLPRPARAPELRALLRSLEERERLRREAHRHRRIPAPDAPTEVADLGGRILSRAPAMPGIL